MRPRHLAGEKPSTTQIQALRCLASMRPRHLAGEKSPFCGGYVVASVAVIFERYGKFFNTHA